MTITGVILFPIYMIIIFMPWRVVIVALLVSSLLSDAALINFGSIGLQPVYVLMLLVITRTAGEIALTDRALSLATLRMMAPLGILLLTCVVVLLIAIAFFQGKIMVVSGTAQYDLNMAEPYSFRRENVAQTLYLTIDIVCVYCLAHLASRRSGGDFARAADIGCLIAGYLAGAVVLWDLARAYINIPFPIAFFHSNAGYSASYSQRIADIPRISGPFSEPSALGYFFSGFILYSWQRYRSLATVVSFGLLLLSAVSLLLSTATTGYFALAFFMLLASVTMASGMRRFLPKLAKGGRRELWLTASFIIGAAAILAFVFANWATLNEVLTAVVFDKRESTSFDQRSGVDLMALNIFIETHGIGLGLGSHKPNNLAMTLLSNVGIAGSAAFAVFVLRLFFQTGQRRDASEALVAARLRAFLLGLLVVHAFSNPGLGGAILWLLFALILGLLVRAQAHDTVANRSAFNKRSLKHVVWSG